MAKLGGVHWLSLDSLAELCMFPEHSSGKMHLTTGGLSCAMGC